MQKLVSFLEHNKYWLLFFLVAVAIVLRGFYVHQTFAESGTTEWKDAKGYVSIGENIAAGNWDKIADTRRGPVIPFLVALFVIVFNDPIIPFLAYNVIITALMILVLYRLGKELFNPLVGWFMAFWGTFFPEAFNYSTQVLKEPTFFFLFPLTLLFMVRSVNGKQSLINLLLAIFSFSLLIHAGERFLIYFPFLILFFFLIKPFSKQLFLKYSLAWVFSILILMLPWGIRNYKVHDQVVIVSESTTFITSGFWGDHVSSTNMSGEDNASLQRVWDERNEQAREFGEKHGLTPRQWSNTEASIRSFLYFWRPFAFNPLFTTDGLKGVQHSMIRNLSDISFWGVFLPFYFFGFFVLLKKKNYIGLLIAFIPFVHSFTYIYLVWSEVRHRAPVLFVMALIGSYVIAEIINGKIKLKNWRIVVE